jgi:phage tail sheath protein FI
LTYHNRVDSPANFRLIEAIVDDENVYGNSLVAEGKCAGARIEYVGGDNNVEDILDGHVRFYQHLAPFTPAEDILNVLEFDPDMLAASFEGGE